MACCITSLKNVNNEWNCVDAHSTERPADATRARETSREMSTAALATLAIPRGLRACLRAGLASRHRASGRRLRPALLAAAADDGGGQAQSQPLDAVRAIETASDNQRNDLAVVLVTPQIPGNTGTIARTCAASRVPLHLVGPLGFDLTDSQLKRAGLDYWNSVCVRVHDDWDAFHVYWRDTLKSPGRLVAFSKFGARPHAEEGAYEPGDWLLFGAETTGLPDAAHDACAASGGIRRIPIDEEHVRSLNLAVSAGIGVYEALRQIDGPPVHVEADGGSIRADAPGTFGKRK